MASGSDADCRPKAAAWPCAARLRLWQDHDMAKTAEAEVTKLRVKIGPHEFEAEGPRDVVAKHFEAWKQLVATCPLGEGTAGPLLPRGDAGTPAAGDMARLDIFAANTRRNLVTLRASLAGKASHADAALLILYGFRRYFGADGQAVLATRLKEALAASGYLCDRVDRALARHVAARLVKHTGRRKGSTYELTPTGHQRAEVLALALRATPQPGTPGA
jgi:hypothetical protein